MIFESVFAMISSLCFAIIFNIKGKRVILAALGGGIGWFFYLLTYLYSSEFNALFVATCIITVYSEVMARVFKTPVTIFLVAALIPLVPGKGMYHTMFYGITGDLSASLTYGYKTILSAGSIAIGIVLVSSMVKIITRAQNKKS